MNMILLKATCKNLTNFHQNTVSVDFIAEKKVNNFETEENTVTHLINSIYKLNTLAFIGINASGKTSTMNILSSIFDIYLGNSSLSQEMKLAKYFSDYVEIESFYYEKGTSSIYKICSKIKKDEDKVLYFEDEILYLKKANTQTNRLNIFDFEDKHKRIDRTTVNDSFLKREDSIFSSLMNNSANNPSAIIDMCNVTFNYLSAIDKSMVMSFVRYLDSSIDKFEVFENATNKPPKFRIKFKNSNNDIIVDILQLDSYLSSGTIKGISFLTYILNIFKNGGYLLIDEIENHFNKTIVINIIRMFSSNLNKNSATLLFSTHYSEILDAIDRSDSIYVLNKKQDIHVNKFSKIAGSYDRIDKKKSDVILSGILDTAPRYSAYMDLKSALSEKLEGGITND